MSCKNKLIEVVNVLFSGGADSLPTDKNIKLNKLK